MKSATLNQTKNSKYCNMSYFELFWEFIIHNSGKTQQICKMAFENDVVYSTIMWKHSGTTTSQAQMFILFYVSFLKVLQSIL